MMKTAILAATGRGREVADIIQEGLPGSRVVAYEQGVKKALEQAWSRYDGIICIMAAGIVVRCVSGLIRSKYRDPCLVIVDEEGRHAISLLSGHLGGGNELAERVAALCKGTPVITTASDLAGHTAVDLWAVEENLSVVNPSRLAATSAHLLQHGFLKVYQQGRFLLSLPEDFRACEKEEDADIFIGLTPREDDGLALIPRIRFVGFGCRRGATLEEFEAALADLQEDEALDLRSIGGAASIDLKVDEGGLLELCERYNWPIRFYTTTELNSVTGLAQSEIVHRKIGAYGVCESAAMLAAAAGGGEGRLIINKRKWKRITAAVAETVS